MHCSWWPGVHICTCSSSCFCALAVIIIPTDGVVSTPGGNANFVCLLAQPPQAEGPIRIQWLMNGSAALLNETIEQGNAHTTMFSDTLWGLDLINMSNQIQISCTLVYSAEMITS